MHKIHGDRVFPVRQAMTLDAKVFFFSRLFFDTPLLIVGILVFVVADDPSMYTKSQQMVISFYLSLDNNDLDLPGDLPGRRNIE